MQNQKLAQLFAGLLTITSLSFATAQNANLINAAQAKYGAKASVEAGTGVVKDKNTSANAYLDNNPHSRMVMTGAPYVITIELPLKVPVGKVSFTQSDYAKEAAPKDIEVAFDGQKVRATLENARPEKVRGKTKINWQDVPIGREIQSLTITVLSHHESEVKWGGLGDIALWTNLNLDEKFRLADYDPKAPIYVHAASAKAETVKVNLPPVAKAGEHPRLLFTPAEITQLREKLNNTERGKATFGSFKNLVDGYLKQEVKFPTPEATAANNAGKEHSSLSYRAGGLGFAYALTGDEKYARAAREILVGYAGRYAAYPRHAGRNKSDSSKVTFQRLSEAMWLIPQIEGYDYIYNSGVLSEADKKLINDGLIRPAIEEIRRKTPAEEVTDRTRKNANWRVEQPPNAVKGDYPNWLNFYNTATLMAGIVTQDQNMIDLAIADLRGAIANGIGADGMWGEGAIGYQLFAMAVMVPAFEAAARQGVDLWGAANGRFKQLFDSPLRYAYPDGTLPGINDSGRGKLGSWQTMVYDLGYLRYGDPRYAFLLNETQRQLHFSEGIYQPTHVFEKLPEPPSVVYGSTLFESLGYAILRNENTYALMDYGPHGGVHGHYDKLNLILFASPPGAKGDEIGGEPKMHGYDQALHPQWTTQTIAHNTLAVDEKSQMANDGKLLVYEDTPQIKIMRAESAGSYPGVLLDRTVITLPDAVIDLFHGRSALNHTWDRTFRYQGKLAQFPLAAAAPKPLGKSDGYEHFQVVATQTADALWQGDWETKAGKFQVDLAGVKGQQISIGKGPDAEEMALARQSGNRADFGAVYGLETWNNPATESQWLSRENGLAAFELKQKDGTVTRVTVARKSGEWELAGWKSDARVLVERRKGNELQLLLGGGTFVQNQAMQFRKEKAGNYLAKQQGNQLVAVSEWAP
ncbi:MAG TPA: alginate lyase family protein [Abditibacteriaceae bacterium]|jgi:hypothetical protein